MKFSDRKNKVLSIIKVSIASGLYYCTCIYGFAILPKTFSPTALGHCDITVSHYPSPFLSFSWPPPLDPSFLFFSAEPAKVLIAHLDLLEGSAFNIFFYYWFQVLTQEGIMGLCKLILKNYYYVA